MGIGAGPRSHISRLIVYAFLRVHRVLSTLSWTIESSIKVMSNPHALIVDDDKNNLEVLAGLLTAEGLTYTAVKDPTKVAAELPKLEKIDVVFCDLEMPRMNGYQLLAMLREQLDPSTTIIACTVHISEIDVTRK